LALVRARCADHLRGYGAGDVGLAERKQPCQPLAFERVLGNGRPFQSKLRNLVFEILIPLADMAQIDIVGPGMAYVVSGASGEFFKRGNGGKRPQSRQTNVGAIRVQRVGWTANLGRKRDSLREQNRDQDKGVLEAADEGFHDGDYESVAARRTIKMRRVESLLQLYYAGSRRIGWKDAQKFVRPGRRKADFQQEIRAGSERMGSDAPGGTDGRAWPPGPGVLGRALDGSLFAVDSPAFYLRNAERYGDVVSFRTPNGFRQFQFNHPETIADVLVRDAGHHLRGVVLRRARGILGDGLLTSEEPLHLRQRRLAQPAFHRARIAGYGREIVRLTREMTADWKAGEAFEAHAEMVRLTLRITSRCLLGSDVIESVQTFVDSMATFNDYLPFALLPGAQYLEKLPIGPMPGMKRALDALDALIFGMIRARRQSGVTGDDLLGMLMEAADESGAMSDRQVRDEALTILLAGHETTANALTFALWLTARHQDAQERMAAEVARVCGTRPPEAADFPQLGYVEKVFAESMRLYPPAWVVARTAIDGYTMRTGEWIPRGAHLIVSQMVVHHDPRWWPNPMRFDPERFTPEAKVGRPKFSYFPFGGGARYCIGEGFAWTEGVLMLATVLQHWHLRLPDPQQERVEITPKFTIRPSGPVPVIADRRS
jgi:cytochrome P450